MAGQPLKLAGCAPPQFAQIAVGFKATETLNVSKTLTIVALGSTAARSKGFNRYLNAIQFYNIIIFVAEVPW